MKIQIPENSFILLISEEGCEAETFAHKFFSDSELFLINNHHKAIFDSICKRIEENLLTVACVPPDAILISHLLEIGKERYIKPVSFIFRYKNSCEPTHPSLPLTQLFSDFKSIKKTYKTFGYSFNYVFNSSKESSAIHQIIRKPIQTNKTNEAGPFDIIGDVHGCFDELYELLIHLGYKIQMVPFDLINFGYKVHAAEKRTVIFLGDIVDRGPKIKEVLNLVMSMVTDGIAYCISGNHDEKLLRYLKGRNVKVRYGLEQSVEQLKNESKEYKKLVVEFLEHLPFHIVLNKGKLIVTHAGIKERMIGKLSDEVKEFCLYGGDPDGDHPTKIHRTRWNEEYHGKPLIVFGHLTVREPVLLNNTIDIDTGCVIGNKLTALRYPEMEIKDIPSQTDVS
jgi:diadenosine tetraphosphatase ApaH/serine/threonine PP2A family protein phosphatase